MLGARSISHLEKISSTGIKAMAEKQIVAILLPTTAYILRLEPPPVQKMIEEGIALWFKIPRNTFFFVEKAGSANFFCLADKNRTMTFFTAVLFRYSVYKGAYHH